MGKNTGGPAFPELGNVAYNSDWQNESGMTLRDYFAAKCMAAVIGTLNGPVVGDCIREILSITQDAHTKWQTQCSKLGRRHDHHSQQPSVQSYPDGQWLAMAPDVS
jgi:hypothetical protein